MLDALVYHVYADGESYDVLVGYADRFIREHVGLLSKGIEFGDIYNTPLHTFPTKFYYRKCPKADLS